MTAEVGHAANRVYVSQSGDLHLNGGKVLDAAETDVTSTFNNALDGLTATSSELNTLHSVTGGTVSASKALVVDATSNLDALAITALSLGAAGGTTVTSTAAEINQLHSQGAVTTDFAKLHAITSSAAEISQLAAQGAVTTDFAKLHAVTSTAAELNQLAAQGAVTTDFAKLHAVSTTAVQINEASASLATDGLTRKGVCRVTYDFSVDGGLVGPIVPVNAPAFPSKAVITRAWAHVLTGFTGGGGATIALSIEGANDVRTAAVIATGGFDSTGFKELIQDGTATHFVQTSAGTRHLTLTVAVAALTAGKAVFELEYVVTA